MTAILTILGGISGRTLAILGGVAAAALAVWLAYSWAYDNGVAAQAAKDAPEITRLTADNATLKGNNAVLQAGIEARNKQIDAYAAAERAAAAAAAKQAKDTLASFAEARKREESRGNGPDAMNGFMADILGGAQ